MAEFGLFGEDLVSWTLSGQYDQDEAILIDAELPMRSISRRKATQLVAQLAGAFPPAVTVCIHLANDILYPILTLAILASGSRWTGTNPSYKPHELEHHFRISETTVIIAKPEHVPAIQAATDAIDTDIEIVLFSDLLSSSVDSAIASDSEVTLLRSRPIIGSGLPCKPLFRNLHDLLNKERDEFGLRSAISQIDIHSTAVLMSTSGTTGLPKMACRTHYAVVEETKAIEDNNTLKPYPIRRLFCTPIFHGFSAPEMLFNSLRLGLPTYFMKRFDDVTYPRKVFEFDITETAAPPPMILRLVSNPIAHPLIQDLRAVFTGGATLLPELRSKFLGIFKIAKPRIVPVWGMTEGGWFTMLKFPESDSTSSVGRCVPGLQVKVCTKAAKRIELSGGRKAGPLCVRSPGNMTGYLHNASATANALHDGWLETGDIGYVENGKVFLVDRQKDIIKVNGFQVSPAELENVLYESADVIDAAVIGIGRDINEHPLALVIPAHDKVTVKQLKDHLATRLASIKVTRCEIRLTDCIPKSASGKVLKTELRKAVKY